MGKIFLLISLAMTSLFSEEKVLAFTGSTRVDSYNKKLLNEAVEIARQMGATVTVVDLKDYPMPFYDADLELKEGMPNSAKQFRELMVSHSSILIASPEYNGSLSAVLKNALDWASRSLDGNFSLAAFKGKKFAIMSASPGKGGGGRGLVHLRGLLSDLRGNVVSTQVTISEAHLYFSEKSRKETPLLKEEIQQLL